MSSRANGEANAEVVSPDRDPHPLVGVQGSWFFHCLCKGLSPLRWRLVKVLFLGRLGEGRA